MFIIYGVMAFVTILGCIAMYGDSDPAGTVQRFAHKVKAGAALELEAGGHFGQAQAAAGGLGLLPAAGGQALEPPVWQITGARCSSPTTACPASASWT